MIYNDFDKVSMEQKIDFARWSGALKHIWAGNPNQTLPMAQIVSCPPSNELTWKGLMGLGMKKAINANFSADKDTVGPGPPRWKVRFGSQLKRKMCYGP